MSTIQETDGNVIVAVVGAGHVGGMIGYLGQNIDRQALCALPTPSRVPDWTRAIAPASFALLLVLAGGPFSSLSGQMLCGWTLLVGSFTALAIVGFGGHLLTATAMAVAAPLTTLLPFVKTGKVAGLLEARLRHPSPQDREAINDALLSFGTMRRNPAIRVLLMVAVAGVSSAIAACAAIAWSLYALVTT